MSMPAPDTLLRAPRARDGGTPARQPATPAVGAPAAARAVRTSCTACGQPWFGSVAHCPYCGRRSGPARPATAVQEHQLLAEAAPPAAQQESPASVGLASPGAREVQAPRLRTFARSLATLLAALLLVVLALGLQDFVDRTKRARTPTPSRPAAAAPAPQAAPAPAAAPAPMPPPAAPARNRSLCSAANEAAGLCNPN